jgi:hypothetical protein
MTGRDARAQWGYGGWGWGGWGAATPQGIALQGAGQYAMGAGMYNLDTSQARSINADTAARWNEYAYLSSLEQARRYSARKNAEFAKNNALYNERQRRLRENPENRDVETGDALNAAVSDLTNPSLGSAAMRAGTAPVSASAIAEIPFQYASERITIMLDGIRESIKWPYMFEGERFAATQNQFDELRKRLREESEQGEVSAKALGDAKRFVNDLRARIEATPLPKAYEQKEATIFLTSCASLLDLLEKPNIGPALLELRKVSDTRIGNLLGFMHAFNLTFGPAKTPKQRQVYHQLYQILDQTRHTVMAEAKRGSPPAEKANPKDATNFFQNLFRGRSKVGTTTRAPRPRNEPKALEGFTSPRLETLSPVAAIIAKSLSRK